ncbi:MAG: cation diffusion facilitator family transporter [Hyphomicrobiales bacterium]
MASQGAKKVVYAALIGNFLIAVTKFIASAYTGSSAMVSEAVHSLVDTGNQSLLLYGMKRAGRPADDRHPFGYAREVYFWAFVVAILIFAIGAGISLYAGVSKILNPRAITNPMVNYAVLAAAMIFEAIAWYFAYREFEKQRGPRGFIAEVRGSKDPTVFTVLFEDTAAMAGLIVALIGIWLTQYMGWEWADGGASIVIGVILGATAAILAYETKGLLIGEAASPEAMADVHAILAATPTIDNINEVRSLHLGPNDVLLALSLEFRDDLDVNEVESAIFDIETAITGKHPQMGRIYIEVQSLRQHGAARG